MATNVAIDPELLERALKVGGERTKKATENAALEKYIARQKEAKIVEHFGTLDWDPTYEHKADRRSRDRKRHAIR